VLVEEDRHPVERVHEALGCLPPYDPSVCWSTEEKVPFLYWKIRDFAHAYRSGITTPSAVSTWTGCCCSRPLHLSHSNMCHRLPSMSLQVLKNGTTRSLQCQCWSILIQMIWARFGPYLLTTWGSLFSKITSVHDWCKSSSCLFQIASRVGTLLYSTLERLMMFLASCAQETRFPFWMGSLLPSRMTSTVSHIHQGVSFTWPFTQPAIACHVTVWEIILLCWNCRCYNDFLTKSAPWRKTAVCVARLRKCGVIFIGKANMHEIGLGVTGNNPNYGYGY
jgi:hypothetical protein